MKNRDLIVLLLQQDMDYDVRMGISLEDEDRDVAVEGVKHVNDGLGSPHLLLEGQQIKIKINVKLELS